MNSLRTRLWLSYVPVVGVALGVVTLGVVWYLLRNPLVYRQALLEMRLVAAEVDARAPQIIRMDAERRRQLLQRLADSFQGRVVLLDAEGQVLADSHPEQPPFWPWPLPAGKVTFRAQGQTWLYYRRTLGAQRSLLVIRPRPRVSLLAVLTDDLLPSLVLAGALALVLALVLAWAVARWVAAPLQRMAAAAEALAHGEGSPIPIAGPDEVQTLAQAFNAMLARVQDTLRAQRDFVANVSHELKTPLTSIQGFAQALLDGTADDPESRRQAAQVIQDEAARMHRLVADLLDLARLDAGTLPLRREPIDLHALLRGVQEQLAPQSREAGVALQLEAGPALPTLIGDADRLTQVFVNLVDNALQHTPAGGEVTLRAAAHGSQVWVSVADTGPGIPPEDLPRIFERFYRVDKSRRGDRRPHAGLGLSIAAEIVRAHGGTIQAQSSPGQGSVFVVKLPTVQPDDTTLHSRRPAEKEGA